MGCGVVYLLIVLCLYFNGVITGLTILNRDIRQCVHYVYDADMYMIVNYVLCM